MGERKKKDTCVKGIKEKKESSVRDEVKREFFPYCNSTDLFHKFVYMCYIL
jgi:hypothetical protein